MNPTPSAARRYVCNNCAATKAGKVCEDCTMHGCQCPCQTHPRYEDENGKFWDYNPQTDKWDILLTNPTDGVPISEEFVRFADANAIGNAVLDALRSIPTVRRATGRTIPDLTKREHVCEYQSAVKSADPATPSAAPWNFTFFTKPDGSEITTPQDVADTVAYSALQCDGATLWGVTLDEKDEDGRGLVICYTGNGPHSEANARLIAGMAAERERTRRMEKALKRLCDLCSCNVLSPYPQPWGETTNDAVAEARAALVDSALKQEPKP